VAGLVSTIRYELPSRADRLAGSLLAAGAFALAIALWSHLAMPVWIFPVILLCAAGGVLWLSNDGPAVVADTRFGRLRAAFQAGMYALMRPSPIRAGTADGTGRQTRAHQFELVDPQGNRTTCEYFGDSRRGAPERGAMVEVSGPSYSGVLRIRRVTSLADGAVFVPRADMRFALARALAGSAGLLGFVLLVCSLTALTLRGI
jgi:hypothetical protein